MTSLFKRRGDRPFFYFWLSTDKSLGGLFWHVSTVIAGRAFSPTEN